MFYIDPDDIRQRIKELEVERKQKLTEAADDPSVDLMKYTILVAKYNAVIEELKGWL